MPSWRNIQTANTGVIGTTANDAYGIVEGLNPDGLIETRTTIGFNVIATDHRYPIIAFYSTISQDTTKLFDVKGACDFTVTTSEGSREVRAELFSSLWVNATGDYPVNMSQTNVPVLVYDGDPEAYAEDHTAIAQYARTGDWVDNIQPMLSRGWIFLNNSDEEEETKEYYIYNKYGDANASYSGLNFTGTIFERYEDFTINGLACLYMPTPFEMSIRTKGSVAGSTFSSIGRGIEEVVTEGSLYYSTPFYNVWDGKKTGSFRVSQNFLQTNMLIFTSLEDIEDFFNGIPDAETKADNYDDIVNSGETSAVNKTGTPEEETTFSVPTHRDTFTSRYIMSSSQLRWLNENYINNEDEIENLINGIRLWGQAKPVEFVIDVTYYPFDLRSICSVVERPEMYFGTYGIRFGSNLGYIKTCDGYKDMGTFTLRPTFNGWRDYEPYQRLFVYLPYVGTYPLDMKRYMNKTINVRYYFDLNTRSCCACLIADGKLMDFWNGQIGITQAISSTDFSNYANSQINTLLSTARNVAIGGATSGVPGALVGGATGVGEMLMNQAQEPRVTNMGSSSSIINEFLPQYVYFIFEISEVNESSNLLSLKGKPSNASGKIGNFSGYLSVAEVDLNCSGATDSEKQEIVSLLQNGIRI